MENNLLSSIIQNSSNGIIIIKNDKLGFINFEAERIFQNGITTQLIEKKLKESSFRIENNHYKMKIMLQEEGLEVIEIVDVTSIIELEDKNCFYEVMLDNISNGVIMSDESGHIIGYNKSNEEFEGLKEVMYWEKNRTLSMILILKIANFERSLKQERNYWTAIPNIRRLKEKNLFLSAVIIRYSRIQE